MILVKNRVNRGKNGVILGKNPCANLGKNHVE